MPPTPPVPLVIIYVHSPQDIICATLPIDAASVRCVFVFLYLHTIVCTDASGTFSCFSITAKEELDLWKSRVFFLPELLEFSYGING